MAVVRLVLLSLLLALLPLSILNIVLHAVAEGVDDKLVDNNVTAWGIIANAIILVWAILVIWLLIDGRLFSKMWSVVTIGLTPLAIGLLGFALGAWFVTTNQEDALRRWYNTNDTLSGVSHASLAFDLITMLVMWTLVPLLVYKALRGYVKRKLARDGTGAAPAAVEKRSEFAGTTTGTGMRTGGSRTHVDVVPTSNVGAPV